ncbi:phage head spike fiber domain-containing protein [Comamonas kerstersii]|uniref:phage head spike fiber domain-containing protein n=1 Tax=Comamonas kerstersii TaxID=225992 RepID=UPI00345D5087
MTAIADLPDIRPSLLLDFANSGRVDPRIECTRASSATCFGPDGKLRTVAANTPRIDYDPATGKCLGLLVEEARTNLLTHSATFSSSTWIKTRSIISAATVIAPDGISFAEKLSEDTQNGAHYIYKNASFTVGSIYTLSIFAKKSERSVINISSGGTSGTNALFDISAGTVLSAGNNASANIRKCGEDWFLCSISFSATNAGSQTCVIGVGDNAGYQGDGVSGIYVWGVQLEVGSFPTSYIPTEGAAVTRAADKVSVPYTTAGAGALFVHGRYDVAAPSTFFSVRARSEGNGYIGTPYCLTSGAVARSSYVRNNGGSPSNAVASGMNISTGLYKSVISWNGKNFASSSNGTISNSMTHELEFPICTHIDLCTASSSGPVLGASHIFQIAGYGAQLSPQNMQRLTA